MQWWYSSSIAIAIWLLTTIELTSQSEILIIRHGRSRSRHSAEKEHVRWGLKAFDNLTIFSDNHDAATAAAVAPLESERSNVVSFYEHNGTFSPSIDFNGTIGSYEINYTYGPSRTSSSSEEHGHRHRKTKSTTTEMPQQQIPVQVVMDRFFPNDKIHRNSRKKEIMTNIKSTVNKGIQYLKSHENLDEIEIEINDAENKKHNKMRAQLSSKPKHHQQQQSHKTHSLPKQIKINGEGKEFTSIVTIPSGERHATNHIKIHQVYNEKDMNIKSNLADIFYVSPTERNPSHAYNKLQDEDDGEMLSDEPAGSSSAVVGDNKMDIKETLMEKSNQPKYDANQNRTNATHVSESNKSNKTTQQNANHAELVQNDEEHEGEEVEIIDDISIQNDEISNEHTIDLIGEEEENGDLPEIPNGFNGIYHFDDVDLSNLDETSRNNRKNLMRGRDVVTRFLQIVESQHMLGNNCTAGTALNLGEGVVDRYAQDRFRVEAEVAVNRANMLTRMFKMSPDLQKDINLLQASVLSMVEFDEDIFAGGHCFDENQYPYKKGLFCPFAHRLPAPEIATLAKDLANEYHYLGNTSEWFFQARKTAEKVIAKNEQYIKAYHSYTNDSVRHVVEILSVKYEDGRWSKPYYDCGGGNIWMLTYTVPFFGFENGTYFFKGTSGIDIDLRRVDIDQCPQMKHSGAQQPLNIFAGTDKCKQKTTECSSIPGLGFRRGSYKCVCRRGYYYPDVKSEFKFFNGTHMEEEYAKWMQSEPSSYNDPTSFECLACAEGCDICEDASPCVAELNWPMRTSILILACAVIGFLPPAGAFTFRYQQVKIVKAASPALLRVIAMGAFLIYCTTIVMYPNPSLYTCVAKIWLRELGFSLTYGALMLKTWRISVIFRVRSAKAVKITDASLIKKLSLLCGFVSVALLIRTLVSPPDVIVGRTADNLKAFLCKTDWWDHTFTSLEVLFLAWGVRLCIVVRKAPSEFNESRFISMAIYNEFLLTCFLNVSMLFLQSPANPDLLYIIFFCHTQLTVTLLLALIFGSKVYLVYRSGGKALEEASHNKSKAAKFISHKPRPTYASASSVNASTGQYPMNGNDNRLSENEAVEEIKQLSQQLQKLLERIPQKCSATNVILTLLDICRAAQNGTGGASLKPLAAITMQNDVQHQTNLVSKVVVDKETNTSHENLTQADGNCCRFMTSDKCDTHKSNNKRRKGRSKCCEAENAAAISCSTNSINFENLHLQCMCSSDNNSLEDEEARRESCQHVSSFRDRLLNFSGASKQEETFLRKRTSELVLGTNFDNQAVYKNSQSHRISKTFDSCDNIYKPSSKSNHSLSTESDQKSIPYSYLERPALKLSQSDDKNLRELKIALTSTLSSANTPAIVNNKAQLTSTHIATHSTQQSTSTSSTTSSKIDKISFSLSTSSSTSDALTKRQNQQYTKTSDVMTNETLHQDTIVDDNKSEDDIDSNKMITSTCENNTKASMSNVNSSNNNNNNVNNGNNNGSRKRKGTESKLAIDLNDRSKYTEEVSV